MKHFWILIRAQLCNQLQTSRKGKVRSPWVSLLAGAMIMAYLSISYSFGLYDSLDPSQYGLGLQFLVCLGTVLLLAYGISWSKEMVFGFRDFDFLMSLPLQEQENVASKLFSFLLMALYYGCSFLLPGVIIYGVKAHAAAGFYLPALAGMLMQPVIPAVISSLLGWMIYRLSNGRKHADLVRNAVQMVLFLLFMAIGMLMGRSDGAAFAARAGTLIRLLPVSNLYVSRAVRGSVLPVAAMIGIETAALFLFLRLCSRAVLKAGAAGNQGYHDSHFRLKRSAAHRASSALLRRDLSSWAANATYMLNTGFGQILLFGGSIYLAFRMRGSSLSELDPDLALLQPMAGSLIISACSLIVHSTCTTGVSISLEGRRLWILKSIPVSAESILFSKVRANLVVALPLAMSSLLILMLAFHQPGMMLLMGIVVLILAGLFTAMSGMAVNLRYPKLEWDREVVAVKQSLSSFLSIFGNLMVGVIVLIACVNGEGGTQFFLWVMLFYGVADLLLYFLLTTWGVKRFQSIG
ncbi:MAG: hypothetical protein PUJ06_02535 [Stecheria intestinalis]|nr:hypothetical protein [Stecheria intestinalis]